MYSISQHKYDRGWTHLDSHASCRSSPLQQHLLISKYMAPNREFSARIRKEMSITWNAQCCCSTEQHGLDRIRVDRGHTYTNIDEDLDASV